MGPKIRPVMSFLDWALEIVGALLLAATWYLLLTNYTALSDQVPIHYDFWGNPNIYGDKELVWLVPILLTAMYIGIYFLHKIPHLLNYPIPVTKTNAAQLYKINLRTLRALRVLIAGQILYGKIGLISISNGQFSKLSALQMPIFLGGLTLIIVISYLLMYRMKNA
ncbi:MAG: DUF1648 domain-containing protein [Cyclobacteriaceae bacterium]|nr:DUF1648 domain-containing protein [Cyclobacteriaceae bacterium HetDA_MAG_MS6]